MIQVETQLYRACTALPLPFTKSFGEIKALGFKTYLDYWQPMGYTDRVFKVVL